MSKLPALPPSVRKSEVFSRLKSVLDEFDVRARVGRARRHYFVEVEVGHTPRKHFFSPGTADQHAIKNNAAALRRVLVTARASTGGGK